jgi:hypothetical protein
MQYSTIDHDNHDSTITTSKFCPLNSNKAYTIDFNNSTVRIGRAKRLYSLHLNQLNHLSDVLNHFSINYFEGDLDDHLKKIIVRLEAEYVLFNLLKNK